MIPVKRDQNRPDIEALVRNAHWMPHNLDLHRGVVIFARLDSVSIRAASFLDYRIESAVREWAEASIDDVISAAAQIGAKRPSFLLHTSYCCSTLLSRAFDAPGKGMSLREPEIIMALSNAYRMAPDQAQFDALHPLRDAVLALLARPHHGAERIVIKPSNAANNLAMVMASLQLPVVVLYGSLRSFLVSVIKKGEPCRTIIRQIYRLYAMDKIGVSAIAQRDALALTDLQIASLVWRHQMEWFNAVLREEGGQYWRSIDYRVLLQRPAEAIETASKHLGVGLNSDESEALAASDLFFKDAKDSTQAYHAERRYEEEAALIDYHRDTLEMIEDWVMKLTLWREKTEILPNALLI